VVRGMADPGGEDNGRKVRFGWNDGEEASYSI
jgi:hypothetical protein